MRQVEEKGMFFQRALGIRAWRWARVWKCIQTGKEKRRRMLRARREAVRGVEMVERSALRMLVRVSYLRADRIVGYYLRKHVCHDGQPPARNDTAHPVDFFPQPLPHRS